MKKQKISFVDISKEVLMCRQEKSISEIKKLQRAVDITENIFEKMYRIIPKCKTENDIIEFLKIETLKAGCTLSYEPIVASGTNAAKIHYHSTPNTKLEKGFCVIDFAVCYEGYHADITRTPYLGKPSVEEKINYELVKNALIDTERDMRPGQTYNTYFEKNLTIGPFPLLHALGHGIGLEIHELPHLGFAKDEIMVNDTIAIEPGIYVQGKNATKTKKAVKPFGIRIEDNYLVTAKGLKRLSKSSRELKII
jgi:Xaa-Pro aminopeptidase